MGSIWSHLPKFNFFEKNLFQSNCCNRNQEISISYTKCGHCRGSGKIFIKSLEYNIDNDDRKSEEILSPTKKKSQSIKNWVKDVVLIPLKNKNYRIFNDGKHIDYGAAKMSDYLIHKDERRRERFHQRFKNNIMIQPGAYFIEDIYFGKQVF